MSKTIKIIDLLNKIAKNEKIPKKIKYLNRIYEFKDSVFGTGYLYENEGIRFWFSEDALSDSTEDLNYEVEIIEDEEKINIQEIELAGLKSFVDADGKIDNVNLAYKYNELLLAVKQLDKKINKE